MLKTALLVLTLVCLSSASYSTWYYLPSASGRSATEIRPFTQPTAAQTTGNHGFLLTQQHPTYNYYPRQPTAAYSHNPWPAQSPSYYPNAYPQHANPGWGYSVSSY